MGLSWIRLPIWLLISLYWKLNSIWWKKNVTTFLRNYVGLNQSWAHTVFQDRYYELKWICNGPAASTTNVISLIIQIPIYIFLFLIYGSLQAFFEGMLPSARVYVEAKNWEMIQGYISGLLAGDTHHLPYSYYRFDDSRNWTCYFLRDSFRSANDFPYVGIFIGATLPVLMALLTKRQHLVCRWCDCYFLNGQFLEVILFTHASPDQK